jgi:hypothetical protein
LENVKIFDINKPGMPVLNHVAEQISPLLLNDLAEEPTPVRDWQVS